MFGFTLVIIFLSAVGLVHAHAADNHSKFAYVTLLCDPDNEDQAEYIRMLLVLKESLRQFDTENDFITMVHGSINEEQWELLDREGIELVQVDPVAERVSNPEPLSVPIEVSECYLSKLNALQLTQYEKIIYLDNDMLVKQDLRPFFESGDVGGSGFVAFAGDESPLNAGFFAVRPSQDDFNEIQNIVKSDAFDPNNGWENYGPFPHWRLDGHTSDWSFWCAHTDQGILYYYYDKVTKTASISPMREAFEFVTHFTGYKKPVLHADEEMSTSDAKVDDSLAAWYAVWDTVADRLEGSGLEINNHATASSADKIHVGVARSLDGATPYCNPYGPVKVYVYNADSDSMMGPLGNTVSCGGPPKTLVATPECKEKVKFKLLDEYGEIVLKNTEKEPPMSLGDDEGDDLFAVAALDTPGYYTLQVNPAPGSKVSFSFRVSC